MLVVRVHSLFCFCAFSLSFKIEGVEPVPKKWFRHWCPPLSLYLRLPHLSIQYMRGCIDPFSTPIRSLCERGSPTTNKARMVPSVWSIRHHANAVYLSPFLGGGENNGSERGALVLYHGGGGPKRKAREKAPEPPEDRGALPPLWRILLPKEGEEKECLSHWRRWAAHSGDVWAFSSSSAIPSLHGNSSVLC